jgi:hypothetical protein
MTCLHCVPFDAKLMSVNFAIILHPVSLKLTGHLKMWTFKHFIVL